MNLRREKKVQSSQLEREMESYRKYVNKVGEDERKIYSSIGVMSSQIHPVHLRESTVKRAILTGRRLRLILNRDLSHEEIRLYAGLMEKIAKQIEKPRNIIQGLQSFSKVWKLHELTDYDNIIEKDVINDQLERARTQVKELEKLSRIYDDAAKVGD